MLWETSERDLNWSAEKTKKKASRPFTCAFKMKIMDAYLRVYIFQFSDLIRKFLNDEIYSNCLVLRILILYLSARAFMLWIPGDKTFVTFYMSTPRRKIWEGCLRIFIRLCLTKFLPTHRNISYINRILCVSTEPMYQCIKGWR